MAHQDLPEVLYTHTHTHTQIHMYTQRKHTTKMTKQIEKE